MITRIDPPLPVFTPDGHGLAHFVIDYGYESHLTWVVFLDSTGECWSYQNPDVRMQKNITHGRGTLSPFYNPDDVAFKTKSQCI